MPRRREAWGASPSTTERRKEKKEERKGKQATAGMQLSGERFLAMSGTARNTHIR